MKRTKIVCTIGPASDNKETLKKMIELGMNVARINFSHGTHESNGKVITMVREISKELNVPVGIMVDLQGPRIRTIVEGEVEIESGEYILVSDVSKDFNFQFSIPSIRDSFQSVSNDQISNKKILLDWPKIIDDIEVGNEILIEDGLKRLRVIEKIPEGVLAQVLAGGAVKNHKGVNIPDAKLTMGAVTEKDERDLEYALSREVDFIALSFVSNGKEIEETREKMKKILGQETDTPKIVSKIERKEAIKNIDEIIEASDVVMVARGDLGIEMDETKVVIFQKEIISKCQKAMTPVIVATQMLDSMINNPIPTRAEVSDVSNAVIDHTDAVMLSGESANGEYPVEAVSTMAKIIKDTEASPLDDLSGVSCYLNNRFSDYSATVESACEMASRLKAKAILMITRSGLTAQMISNCRPVQRIFVAINNEKTYNQLSIVWGVETYLFDKSGDMEKFMDKMIDRAKEEGKIQRGDKLVVIIGRLPNGEKMRLVGTKEVM